MTDTTPESASEIAADDETTFPWLRVAIATQVVAIVWGFFPLDDPEAGLITSGVIGLLLLIQVGRGSEWARKGFLAINMWALVLRGLVAFAAQYFPKAEYEINWVNMILSVVAVYAVLKLPRRTREVRPTDPVLG
ncbi:hypothetical protein I6E68_02930 [Salinibacterium sp. NSLL150]|uniref:hypothetical protein n=1 Tax=unclassified Salinibacterium TaxID=2632331 RepID=UPI0018CE5F43|nr:MULTISPECIES: hypothetical protein [unclassified Salinibacterium]MBH0098092.1 hypothetical protein [Salinibacterium sp. NSLL35]MBH0100847.1 hypothetical protein [Salinibacterium sp. NSLL150]MBH0103606.1 hypothetical protein [Salinibacterium sp. NSLL16]MBH0106367.1 hypothetical protein [Salinibacterium sp. NSLL17]